MKIGYWPKMNHLELDSHIKWHRYYGERVLIICYDINVGFGLIKYSFGLYFHVRIWRFKILI